MFYTNTNGVFPRWEIPAHTITSPPLFCRFENIGRGRRLSCQYRAVPSGPSRQNRFSSENMGRRQAEGLRSLISSAHSKRRLIWLQFSIGRGFSTRHSKNGLLAKVRWTVRREADTPVSFITILAVLPPFLAACCTTRTARCDI